MRALHDYRGEKVKEARPGTPVEILGFDKPPAAGENARVVENERQARHLAGLRAQRVRAEQLARGSKKGVSLEDLFTRMGEGGVQELNVIVKGDVQGSLEAVVGELAKIKHPEVAVNVIHTGIGAITESDVMLASASSAIIAGFNVRPNAEARSAAERDGVDIRTYRVIYQLTEDIQQALVGMLAPEQVEESLGDAEVRALFRASRLGVIAGCMVTRGVIRRNSQIRVVREGAVVYETTIASLKRFKDDVREVQEGFECGILLENFNDVKEGDILEAYETRQIERTDLDVPAGVGAPSAEEAAEEAEPVGAGYVGILSVELHFPENHSLKGKRKELLSVKAQLQRRFGASVAEVDHHDVWQRARLTLACVAREHKELQELLDGAERYLAGQAFELGQVEREVVTFE